MRSMLSRLGLLAGLLAAACASSPDRFYTLSTLPDADAGPSATPTMHVLLNVTIPQLVDRSEMVVSTSRNEILVLDHERWAIALSDHVAQTLARDIERRRPDILIGDRAFDQTGSPPVTVKVDIVRMSVQRGAQASIEARWRIADPGAGTDELGSTALQVPVGDGDYSAIARAYSQALSALADKLAGGIRRR